jgi:hypothetical protein
MFKRLCDLVLLLGFAAFISAGVVAGALTAEDNPEELALGELEKSWGANPAVQQFELIGNCWAYAAQQAGGGTVSDCTGNLNAPCVYCIEDFDDWLTDGFFEPPGYNAAFVNCGTLFSGTCISVRGHLVCSAVMTQTNCADIQYTSQQEVE